MAKIITHRTGVFTFLASTVLISVLAYVLGGWDALLNFVPTDSNSVGTTLALVVVNVILSLGLGYIVHYLCSRSSASSSLAEVINSLKGGHNFLLFFVCAFLEEVYARWLFLGALPTVLNPTPIVWWTLILVGNGSWAFFHLYNFSGKRRIIWVLPQFIGGLIFSLVYVKFGFLAAVYCHFGSNALLLCLHKIEDVVEKDIWIASYCAFVSLLAGVLLAIYSTNFEIMNLLNKFSTGEIINLRLWEWIFISVFVTYFLKAISIVFLYDAGMVEKNGNSKDPPLWWEIVLGLFLLTCILSGVFLLVKVFSPSIAICSLLAGILVCCLFRTNSGSGAARNFWLTMPKFLVLSTAFEYGGLVAFAASVGSIFFLYIPLFVIEGQVE